MDRRERGEDRFESHLEVSLAGLDEGMGWRGRPERPTGVRLHGQGGDGAINQGGEHRRRSSLKEKDNAFGFGHLNACGKKPGCRNLTELALHPGTTSI